MIAGFCYCVTSLAFVEMLAVRSGTQAHTDNELAGPNQVNPSFPVCPLV